MTHFGKTPAIRASKLAAALVALVALVIVSAPAQAGTDKATLQVRVAATAQSESEDADPRFEEAKRQQITKRVASRLEKRLEAARIKHFSVEVKNATLIEVTARGDISEPLLAGLVIPAGRFELRPVESVGDQWMRRLPGMPEGVELRQPSGSMVSGEAFLWSRSEKTLREAIEAADIDGFDLAVYPSKGGWRSLALGAAVATQNDISSAEIRQSKTGRAHVRINLKRSLSAANTQARTPRRWAVVLDGEVVTLWRRGDDGIGSALTLPAPSHLGSREAGLDWARQVAGRLAAHLPVALLEATDKD